MTSKTESEKPIYVEHDLVHYKQRYNWDCGVSCALMVLPPEQRSELLERFDEVCAEEGFRQSTWTIRQNMIINMLSQDRERVQRRFASAPAGGVVVKHALLPTRDVLQHVARHGPAILLVDAGLLACQLCKHNKLRAEFRRCFGGSYRGHYIVVTGVMTRDTETRALYHDPALTSRVCCVSLARMDDARRATGTDYDVILVFKDFR